MIFLFKMKVSKLKNYIFLIGLLSFNLLLKKIIKIILIKKLVELYKQFQSTFKMRNLKINNKYN